MFNLEVDLLKYNPIAVIREGLASFNDIKEYNSFSERIIDIAGRKKGLNDIPETELNEIISLLLNVGGLISSIIPVYRIKRFETIFWSELPDEEKKLAEKCIIDFFRIWDIKTIRALMWDALEYTLSSSLTHFKKGDNRLTFVFYCKQLIYILEGSFEIYLHTYFNNKELTISINHLISRTLGKKMGSMKNKNEEYLKSVGARIKKYREEKKMTEEELALKSTIEIAILQKIERGEYDVDIIQLKRISEALLIKIAFIVDNLD